MHKIKYQTHKYLSLEDAKMSAVLISLFRPKVNLLSGAADFCDIPTTPLSFTLLEVSLKKRRICDKSSANNMADSAFMALFRKKESEKGICWSRTHNIVCVRCANR